MRSYAVVRSCEPVQMIESGDLQPSGTEVVIAVTRCGVCHSDLHLQDGYYNMGGGKKLMLAERGIAPPFVMGHEVLGRLIAKGPEAPIGDDQIGKVFLVYPWLGCGTCDACLRGDENLCSTPCAIGINRAGGYAEQCLVPHPRYLIDVEGLDPTLAATYACSGLTAYSAIKKVDLDKEKEFLLVIGAGGVGLSAIHIAQALGYKNIAVADIDAGKRAAAEQAGAKVSVDSSAPDAVKSLRRLPGLIGGVVDFVGAPTTANFGIAAVRKAGTYVAVGLFGGELAIALPALIIRALDLRGSYVGSLNELKELIALAKAGRIKPLPVEKLPLDDVNLALDRLRAGKVNGRLVLART
ncbi:MAG: alcohol dehydrogenase [Beijerinckiaceae bacterium]